MDRDFQGGHGGPGGAGHEGGFRRGRRELPHRRSLLLLSTIVLTVTGPVTDYGSTLAQWTRHRQPHYKGGVPMEAERPSPSYIIDVGSNLLRIHQNDAHVCIEDC